MPVILDGENAWEYFPDSGETFLSALMDRLGSLSPAIECIPMTEAIDRSGDPEPLPGIPTGSWIDGTFSIWIGHQEDHEAWDMLSRARALWQRRYDKAKRSGIELPDSLSAAREHLLVAEGSDWCWWYGDEHFTPHGPEFDRLFRKRIKAAYRELGETAPDSLNIPIVRPDKIPSVKNHLCSPRGYIRPRINGKLTSYFEWSAATRYVPTSDFGTMHRSESAAMSCLYYGFDESTLYLRVDLHHRIFEPPGNLVEVEFLFPGKNRKVHLLLDPGEKTVRCAAGTIGEDLSERAVATMPDSLKAAFHKVMELGIPFQELGCEGENQIGFFLTIRPKGSVGERYPTYGQFTADLPGSDFEERMWEV